MLGRRTALAAGAAGLLVAPPADAEADPLSAIERRHGGRLGVFALDTGSGRTLAHRADERFLLCSSFKGVLAALVLQRVDRGQDSLAAPVRYGPADLLGVSPVTRAHVAAGALPVGALAEAIVTRSDNAAANLLLHRVGGPPAVTGFLRSIGDDTTRLDRFELALNVADGDLDTTTPRAITGTARTLLLGDVLAPASRARLEHWMHICRTGTGRLRASFPRAWFAADKTGTSQVACNDYALARRPGAAPLVMAAYYNSDGSGDPELVLRAAGAAIVRWSRRASAA